jgi:hypothetical protein
VSTLPDQDLEMSLDGSTQSPSLRCALAIPGIINPVTGALLHELSSIPVIANSARLIGLKEASSTKADRKLAIAAAA